MANTMLASRAAQACGTYKVKVSRLIKSGKLKARTVEVSPDRRLHYVDADELAAILAKEPKRAPYRQRRPFAHATCIHCGRHPFAAKHDGDPSALDHLMQAPLPIVPDWMPEINTVADALREIQVTNQARKVEIRRLVLQPNGLRELDGWLVVANVHPSLEWIFQGTKWARGYWKRSLLSVDGSRTTDVMAYSKNVRQRGVAVPINS